LAITVDPVKNIPEALRGCANGHGSKVPRWLFLTGTEYEIGELAGRDAIYMKQGPTGDVDHTVLTSLIDSEAVLRVQGLELRLDPTEYLDNSPRLLLREGRR
jgi:protein SCO1/2